MYTFIVNPHSRSGLGYRIWKDLEMALQAGGTKYQVFFTEYKYHATQIANNLSSSGKVLTLIALGGDGTINEVVNGIVDFSNITFGYIPIGSGNDFARSMKISKDPVNALHQILFARETTSLNIGRISYGPQQQVRRFAVSAGIGYDAAVCQAITTSKVKPLLNRLKIGKLVYLITGVKNLFSLKASSAELCIDGQKTHHFDGIFFIAFMNQPYEGGGFRFAPKAKADDGYLDVVVLEEMPKIKALCLIPLALLGLHTPFKDIDLYRCKNISVTTKRPMCLHVDGEPLPASRQIQVSLEEKALPFLCK